MRLLQQTSDNFTRKTYQHKTQIKQVCVSDQQVRDQTTHAPVVDKCFIVAKEVGKLSGYMRMYPISLVDQPVFRKVGRELS